jgi:hypothetical protein
MEEAMPKKKIKSVMPIYITGLAWLGYALCFPLYKTQHFIYAAIYALVANRIAANIWKPKFVELPDAPAPEPIPEPPKAEEAPKKSENPELDAFITEGQRAVSEMNRLNDNIADEEISLRISQLTELTGKIFAHVTANPNKLSRARKFVNYYVPTTIKLLNAYDRMGAQGIDGENISGTMRKIEDILDTIVTAFEKQLDNLFSAEAMDLAADITVLEGMIEREGFTNR